MPKSNIYMPSAMITVFGLQEFGEDAPDEEDAGQDGERFSVSR
jgi:hypothetical protein